MQDVLTMLNTINRPRILMRAARIGAQNYRRDAHLPRLLGYGVLPRHGPALMRLLDIEAEMESARVSSDAGYSLIRHVDILIAMVGEARDMRTAQTIVSIT